jgi:hypothetical protein
MPEPEPTLCPLEQSCREGLRRRVGTTDVRQPIQLRRAQRTAGGREQLCQSLPGRRQPVDQHPYSRSQVGRWSGRSRRQGTRALRRQQRVAFGGAHDAVDVAQAERRSQRRDSRVVDRSQI